MNIKMGCTTSLGGTTGGQKKPKTLKLPITQYQITLLADSWPDIEKDSLNFGTGIFEK